MKLVLLPATLLFAALPRLAHAHPGHGMFPGSAPTHLLFDHNLLVIAIASIAVANVAIASGVFLFRRQKKAKATTLGAQGSTLNAQ